MTYDTWLAYAELLPFDFERLFWCFLVFDLVFSGAVLIFDNSKNYYCPPFTSVPASLQKNILNISLFLDAFWSLNLFTVVSENLSDFCEKKRISARERGRSVSSCLYEIHQSSCANKPVDCSDKRARRGCGGRTDGPTDVPRLSY